jgi:hypothetical protein
MSSVSSSVMRGVLLICLLLAAHAQAKVLRIPLGRRHKSFAEMQALKRWRATRKPDFQYDIEDILTGKQTAPIIPQTNAQDSEYYGSISVCSPPSICRSSFVPLPHAHKILMASSDRL